VITQISWVITLFCHHSQNISSCSHTFCLYAGAHVELKKNCGWGWIVNFFPFQLAYKLDGFFLSVPCLSQWNGFFVSANTASINFWFSLDQLFISYSQFPLSIGQINNYAKLPLPVMTSCCYDVREHNDRYTKQHHDTFLLWRYYQVLNRAYLIWQKTNRR